MSAQRLREGQKPRLKPKPKPKQDTAPGKRKRSPDAPFGNEKQGAQDLLEIFEEEPVSPKEELSPEEEADEDGDFSPNNEDEEDLFFVGEPFLGKGLNVTWLWMEPGALIWCLPFSGKGMQSFVKRDQIRSQLERLFQAFERAPQGREYFSSLSAPAFFRQMLSASYFLGSEENVADKKSLADSVSNDLDCCGIALWGKTEPFMEAKDLLRKQGAGAANALPVDREYLWLQAEFLRRQGFPLNEILGKSSFWREYSPEILEICNDFRRWVGDFFEKAFGPCPPDMGREYLPPFVESTFKKHRPFWKQFAETLASKEEI